MKSWSIALASVLASVLVLGGCDSGGGDDIDQPIDAPDVSDGGIDSGDGGGACVLNPTVVTCTAGNDAPCTAICANAYCYNFNQVGTVCTQPCTPGSSGECPSGWSCNNMGRCRPPG